MSEAPIPAPSHEAVQLAELTVDWQRYGEHSSGVVIEQPGVGDITGTLYDRGPDRPREIYVDMFAAETPGEGSGKRLLEHLKEQAIKYRAGTMSGHFTSEAALGAFLSVTGGKDLAFRKRFSGKPANVSIEEAMQSPKDYIATATISDDVPRE